MHTSIRVSLLLLPPSTYTPGCVHRNTYGQTPWGSPGGTDTCRSVKRMKLDLVPVNQEHDIWFHFSTGSPNPFLFRHLTNGKIVDDSVTKIHIPLGR